MGKLTIKLSLFTSILISIFFLGCTHFIKVSTFAKYNKINNNFFQTFSNDSLEIAINFSGAHKYQDISTPKKIAVPPDILKSLKQVTKKTDYKLLLYSTSKHYNTYYGFIIKKEGTIIIKNNFAEYQNSANEKFLISGLYKYKKSINVVSVVSLPMHYVLFINSLPINSKNNSIDKFETDSTYLVRNTFAEISSILTDFNFFKKAKFETKLSDSINKYLYQKDSYLKPVKKLLEINIDTAYQLKSFYYQSLLTRLSFLDNLISIKESYETYLSYLREKKINTNEIKKEMISIGTNVLDDIPKIAKANKVIMINESHYDFRHRYFLYLAIDSLYKYGYRHLCIEDYINNGEVKQTFPTKSNGFYIMDPFMAQLIRKANSLGFQLHSYEDTSSNSSTKFNSEIEKREYNQASNLANLYKTDSINKWVVYAGYEHINKKSFMSIYKSCAQYFYDFTGVDPYSINQNEYSDITNKNVLEIDRPVGYYSLDTASSVYKKEQVNLYILNNIEKHPYEYPLPSLKSSLTAYSISSNQNIDSSGYLFIYIKNEFDKLKNQAIPVYIGQINLKKKTILYLPENNYISFITYNEEDVMIKCNMKLL